MSTETDLELRAVVETAAQPEGAMLTRSVRGDLVRVGVRTIPGYTQQTTGSGSGGFDVGNVTATNPDGSGAFLALSTTNTFADSVVIIQPFYGRVCGIRFRRDANTPDFCVSVDDEAFGVFGKSRSLTMTNEVPSQADEAIMMIAEDLKEGAHNLRIEVNGIITAGQALVIYGYLFERRAGYSDPPRSLVPANNQAVPTTSTNAAVIGGLPTIPLAALRKIVFHNSGASPYLVYIGFGTSAANAIAAAGQVWELVVGPTNTLTGPPWPTAEVDLGKLMNLPNGNGGARYYWWTTAPASTVYAHILGDN